MSTRLALAASLGAAVLLGSAPARAGGTDPEDDLAGYRTHKTTESPQNYAFELRFGPYRPNVDESFSGAAPYERVYGTDHRLYIGAEFDWQAIRIPHLGTLGPGFGWGYTHMSANALLTSTGQPSAETTSLSIMPMYGVGVLRIDVLARETSIPIVPYGKAGLGYALWWATNDLGTSQYADSSGNITDGKGRTYGSHFAVGGMFLLDAIDPYASVQLDNETGVNNSYVYFEWMMSRLDGFGAGNKVMHVGTNTWVMGLALEM